MKTGIYLDMDEDTYHADPDSISKSGLWTLHSKTPAHYRYAPPRIREPQLDFGKAVHMLVLQPDLAREKIVQGPPDRRGNKWKDALAKVESVGGILLPEGVYNEALSVQEAAAQHPVIKKLNGTQTLFEASAFWTDERAGVGCRCRPDLYAPPLCLMADLKTTADASAWNWAKTAGNLGYHVQEAIYTEGWQKAGGGDVQGFVFIVIESKAPFCVVVYELEPSAVTEGSVVFQRALDKYKECLANDDWPGYPATIQALDIPGFSYRETDSPNI
jgi:exodeoxyribonuclease VIII|tara:strand:+ start:1065 stop:1883 length:819 start_codon:yes stop_codon:yes gene_type:complete